MTTPLVLLNSTTVSFRSGTHTLPPGEVITDPVVQGLVTAAGGLLLPPSYALTAASALALKYKRKGQDQLAQVIYMIMGGLGATLPTTLVQSVTGPGGSAVLAFPNGLGALAAGFTASLIMNFTAQVTEVGVGGDEVLGDVYSYWGRVTLKNTAAGGIVVVQNRLNEPEIDADASMTDVVVTPGGTAGNIQFTLTNGAQIGAGAVVKYSIDALVRVF